MYNDAKSKTMKKLLTISIQKRWLMLALFLLLGFFGYYSWTRLSIEAYPDIADVTSQVVTQVPGLAAEEVEQQKVHQTPEGSM